MKNIIFLLSVVFIVACQAEKTSYFENELTNQSIFRINSKVDTLLASAKGTLVYIPKHSFSALDNKDLVVKVVEYYSVDEITLSTLDTRSKDDILETAGMLDISVFSGDEEINLNNDKFLIVHFPVSATRNDNHTSSDFSGDRFKIFYAKKNNEPFQSTEWLLDTTNLIEKKINISMTSYSVSQQTLDDDNFRYSVYGSPENSSYFFADILEDYQFSIKSINEISSLENHVEVYFKLSTDGIIHSINIPGDIEIGTKEELADFMSSISPLNPYQTSDGIVKEVDGIFYFDIFERPIYQSDSLYIQAFENRINSVSEKNRKFSRSELDYYIFSISKIGLINCDRFIEIGNKIDQNIEVDVEDIVKVKMVFDSLNSFIIGEVNDDNNGFVFKDIPNDEIVTIVMIQEKDGRIFSSFKNTRTSVKPITNFEFSETSIEELKNKLSF